MEMIEFAAEPRGSLGSGAARRFRRKGAVPAVLYGHGEPLPILIDSKQIERTAALSGGRNLVFNIGLGTNREPAIIRDLQRHPVTRQISHVDFLRVLLTEKITTSVRVELVGASEAVKLGGILMSMIREVVVRALPLEVPDKIVADIGVMKTIGDSLHVRDLVVPSNVEIVTPGRVTLASVQAPAAEEAPTAAAVAAEGAVPAEGAAAPAEGAAAASDAKEKAPEKGKTQEKGKKE